MKDPPRKRRRHARPAGWGRQGGIVVLVLVLVLVLGSLLAAGCSSGNAPPAPAPASPSPTSGSCEPVAGTPGLTVRRLAAGLDAPLDLQAAPGDRTRLFVVEQGGRIVILRDGVTETRPFLDVSDRISRGGERGLLGLAFHPRFPENGRFFVNYTGFGGETHIAEFRVSADPDVADPSSGRDVLVVSQPFANHNGGSLAFGPEGRLYVALGDGGSGGDPLGNGQGLGTLLGKILRLDVDQASPYAVPADNPFVGRPGARPEIWAYGLRNPWRIAFDPATGVLYIGDVGQRDWEEIDVAQPGRGGENYGWNIMEGGHCFSPGIGCDRTGLTLPVVEYGHEAGCSVTGGVVYRGCRMPGYHGTYFYGDYCSAFVRSFRLEGGQAVDRRDWTASLSTGLDRLTSFGVDADGEIYLLDQDGEIYQVVPDV